jgi:glycosyltransferase involved in cell wall biosynthesis
MRMSATLSKAIAAASTDDVPLISIIVPVYNVAPYLRQCLDSVAAQTLPRHCFEVLLIDDASTDGSLEICLDYARRHANFRIFPLPEHTPGGCGAPSNIGIKAARGTYIGFVDSDDYIHPEMFDELLTRAFAHDADIAICDQYRLDVRTNAVLEGPDTGRFRQLEAPSCSRLSDHDRKIQYLNLDTPPWLKIYRRSFLEEHGLAFPEGDFFFEDVVFHWRTLLSASRTVHANKKLVTHRINRAGQTIRSCGRALLGVLPVLRLTKNFLVDTGQFERYKLVFMCCVAKRCSWMPSRLDSAGRRLFFKRIRSLTRDFSWREFPAYCRINRLRLRTGIKHFALLRGCRRLALLAA